MKHWLNNKTVPSASKQALDLQSHRRSLINSYEQAVKANRIAGVQQRMALELK